ncbi:MAG: Do family serine endopeptidase [Bauldia sp.]|nr:Do family serine endopeptidase [Bauldia sp.]
MENPMSVRHTARRSLAALALAATVFATPATAQFQPPESLADLTEGILGAVVNIATSQTLPARRGIDLPELPQELLDLFGDEDAPLREVESLGSGFVIDETGYIVTNNHVIDDADEIWAVFDDGTRLAARLIGYDPPTDLAVLKVEPPRPLTAVSFGDSEALRIGDWVVAIGNPFGLGTTVTVGVLSARNRNINSGPFDDYLQTDASINRGNSGGPLFDMNGEVVGVNTAILSETGESIGIAFSVPSSLAQPIVEQLIEFGTVRRGRIGVIIQEVTDGLAEGFGLADAAGALVVGYTEPDSPARDAGVEIGDIIIAFDGRPIGKSRDLTRIVAGTPVGSEVETTLIRDGEEITLTVGVAPRGDGFEVAAAENDAEVAPDEVPELTAATLGVTVAEITPAIRQRFALDAAVAGIVVTNVQAGTPASERRLRPGDVIVEVGVGGDLVTTPAAFEQRLAAEEENGRGAVILLMSDARGNLRFEWLRIGPSAFID